MVRIIWLAFLIPFFFISSCSESDDPVKESNVTGSWSGIIIQPYFGELLVDFSINNTSLNGQSGTGSFKSGDISVCDENQFNCVPLACSFNLSIFSMSGDFYEIDQVLNETNTTCGDGVFEATLISDNELSLVWYEEEYPENKAMGILTRK